MPELARRPSLFSHTLNQLGRQIVSGHYGESGMIPPEPKLCEQLGASRGVLREVLRVLSQKGLISAQPKVGIRVEPERNWNVMDLAFSIGSGNSVPERTTSANSWSSA